MKLIKTAIWIWLTRQANIETHRTILFWSSKYIYKARWKVITSVWLAEFVSWTNLEWSQLQCHGLCERVYSALGRTVHRLANHWCHEGSDAGHVDNGASRAVLYHSAGNHLVGICYSKGHGLFRFVGCLTSQKQVSVSQGRICSDKCTGCHTESEVADHTFCLTQSRYTDTGPTSPSADLITPGARRVAAWVPVSKLVVWLDMDKESRMQECTHFQ